MKKLILGLFLSIGLMAQAQFFGSSNKSLLMVGATFADDNTGLYFSYEEQLGDYISLGINPILLLGNQEYTFVDGNSAEYKEELKFGDKFDLKAKMSIHFSEVLKIEKFDFYPGLNVGIHNLGFHAGAQLYLASGFAAFTEINLPIAKYKDSSLTSFNNTYVTAGLGIDL